MNPHNRWTGKEFEHNGLSRKWRILASLSGSNIKPLQPARGQQTLAKWTAAPTTPLVYSDSFVECHCLLSSVTGELRSCSWDHEASNIYCLSPFRKSLPIPGICFLQRHLTMPIRSVHLSISGIPIVGTCQGNDQRCRFRYYRYTKTVHSRIIQQNLNVSE